MIRAHRRCERCDAENSDLTLPNRFRKKLCSTLYSYFSKDHGVGAVSNAGKPPRGCLISNVCLVALHGPANSILMPACNHRGTSPISTQPLSLQKLTLAILTSLMKVTCRRQHASTETVEWVRKILSDLINLGPNPTV